MGQGRDDTRRVLRGKEEAVGPLLRLKGLAAVEQDTWARRRGGGREQNGGSQAFNDGTISGDDHVQGVSLEASG